MKKKTFSSHASLLNALRGLGVEIFVRTGDCCLLPMRQGKWIRDPLIKQTKWAERHIWLIPHMNKE